jgi:hypothetical protein
MDNQLKGLHHTYRGRRWYFSGFFGVFLFFLAAVLIIQRPHLLIVCLIIFLFALLEIYSALSIRLTTSSEGIMYHQVGYGIFAKWDQIESIGECTAGRVRTECLLLNEFKVRGIKQLANLSGLRPKGKSIPIGLFDRNWRDGDLGQDINEHAPNVCALRRLTN